MMLFFYEIFENLIAQIISVSGAWEEPFPGWVDNISGATGIVMEIGRGSLKSVLCKGEYQMDTVPVDIVVNTLIAAAWHINTKK